MQHVTYHSAMLVSPIHDNSKLYVKGISRGKWPIVTHFSSEGAGIGQEMIQYGHGSCHRSNRDSGCEDNNDDDVPFQGTCNTIVDTTLSEVTEGRGTEERYLHSHVVLGSEVLRIHSF